MDVGVVVGVMAVLALADDVGQLPHCEHVDLLVEEDSFVK